jgi:hypothetical protein
VALAHAQCSGLGGTHGRLVQAPEERFQMPPARDFSESALQRYRTRFIPPEADEPHLTYHGDPEGVIAELEVNKYR